MTQNLHSQKFASKFMEISENIGKGLLLVWSRATKQKKEKGPRMRIDENATKAGTHFYCRGIEKGFRIAESPDSARY